MSKRLPPFYLDEDQVWIEDWLNHILETFKETEGDGLTKRGNFSFTIVYENGKLVPCKKSWDGKLYGTHFSWQPRIFSSDEVKSLFWRPEDSTHLQEWLVRCEGGLSPLTDPKQIHQVMITIWIPLNDENPILHGKIYGGIRTSCTRHIREVIFEFETKLLVIEENDFFHTPVITKEERRELLERKNTNKKSLYVCNFNFNTTENALGDFFSRYGKVVSVMIPTNHNGQGKGFGFVEFANEEDALKALDEADGKELEGRDLVVKPARWNNQRR
jgi:hypothetical protein